MRDIAKGELLLMALLMGFSSSIAQILLIREILTLCRGNELIIGMIFSSWFLGIYWGARYRPSPVKRTLERRVLVSVILMPVLTAVSVYSSGLVQVLFPRAAGSFYSISTEVVLALLFTLPVSFFVGFFFPALVSLISGETGDKSGGLVFYAESLGSFAGGIAFSFVLVDRANPLAISSLLLSFALGIILVRGNRRLLFLAAVPLVLAIFSDGIEKKMFAYVWDRTHTGRLIQHQRTKYETVAVESSGETVTAYGDGVLIYTIPDRYEARGIFHLVQSLRQERRRMLILGSGPGSLLHNLLRADIDAISYFDTDPELWPILHPYARRFYGAHDNKKLSVPGQDLRHFLKNSRDEFDMIITVPPQPDNIMLNRFYTREFYAQCRGHLTSRGIFIAGLRGFSNYMSNDLRDYIASIYAAFSREFPVHLKTSGDTIYLIGAKQRGILPESIEALIAAYGSSAPARDNRFEREVMQNFSPDELKMFFERTQLDYFDSVIAPRARTIDANRDLKPGAYWKNIVFTAFKEQSALHFVLRNFVFIPLILLVLTGAALWDIRRKHGSVALLKGLFMYLTGFISISTMIVLILIYQNSQGIVYYRISLISALYMLGLALGGFTFNQKRILKLPVIFIAIAAALGSMLIFVVHEAGFLYWTLIPVFSFLCGALFPLLFASGGGTEYYTAASVLDSMDHFGGIAGSLLTVVLVLPLLGLQGAIALNIILSLSAWLIAVFRF
ncbi:MAG: hypothetical protein A2W19_17390 [Spirochaetes bacterium RBG_16_49_21]|nr:MAG: hypothetical protein A2W19_17390 [Spirochaetes bacterium RBG_16_49_21]